MSRLHLDAAVVERQVADLLDAYPDLEGDEALKLDMIEGETDATEFLSRVARAMRAETAMAKATKEAAALVADDFKRREEAATKRAEGLRALAFRILTAAKPNGPVRLPEATLSIAAVPSKLVIEDETLIPRQCFVPQTVEKLNREAVKALIDNNQAVPGASMSKPSTRLNVRWA